MNVLYVGSGKSALMAKNLDLSKYTVVAVNNAWRIFEDLKIDYWIHPNDFPADKFPNKKIFGKEIIHKDYEHTSNLANEYFKWNAVQPMHYCGYTIFFQGIYWIMFNLKPKKIYLLGFDHDYNMKKVEFWKENGMPGLDVKKKEPNLDFSNFESDFFYGHGNPDPLRFEKSHLASKFDLLKKNANLLNIKLFNLSSVTSEINTIEKGLSFFNYSAQKSSIIDSCNTFLIIGAMDGVKHDIFFDLIKNKSGKKIIFVEPVKFHFEKLIENTKNLNHFIFYENCPISDKKEKVKFCNLKQEKIKEGTFLDGCSCVIEDGKPLNIFMQRMQKQDVDEFEIECLTFEEVLDKYSLEEIDYIQIDTEGYDERIVKSINLEKYKVKYLQFEKYYANPSFLENFKIKMFDQDYLLDEVTGDIRFLKKNFIKNKIEIENGAFSKDALEFVIKNINFSTVLDIGCGSGAHSTIFKSYDKTVTSIDLGISSYYQKSKNAAIITNFMNWGIEEKFDLVWCSHILEHQKNVGLFIEKIYDCAKDGGYICVTVPPRKDEIVGGHLTIWNAGLLLYNLIINGIDCKEAKIKSYGYNITVLVKKTKKIDLDSLNLSYDIGDIEKLSPYFPIQAVQNFNGNIKDTNWN